VLAPNFLELVPYARWPWPGNRGPSSPSAALVQPDALRPRSDGCLTGNSVSLGGDAQ
jgi:hypothetical protein